jgi:prevent-host-death family protein
MDETISAAQAKRHFSKLLQAVCRGRSFLVTSHGKPVAKIIPVGALDEAMTGARAALVARLRSQPIVDIGRWTRDVLYE